MRVSDLFEVEVGGGLELGDFPDDLPSKDLSSNQLDLFKSVPTGEPNLPPNLKLRGRMGEFYVAERLEKGSKGSRCFVWIHDGKAASYLWLTPYTLENLNYPSEMRYRPDLHGTGFRVSAVFATEEFRGQKIGPKMYQWCLENVCDYLMADSMQTPAGVALWKYLRRLPQFAVQVWDGDKYMSRHRKTGKDFDHVYNTSHLIPWVTLKSKLEDVLDGPVEEAAPATAQATLDIQWVEPRQARAALSSGSETVVWVDVAKIDEMWKLDRSFYVGPEGSGEGAIKGRYPRFDMWMADRQPVEMSEISLGYRGVPGFGNGRHRFAWMRDHGAKAVPVVTPVADLEEFKARYGTDLQKTTVTR